MRHTFKIVPYRGGFRLRDTCKFNNWGTLKTVFTTEEDAEAYAIRCEEFKTGRRMEI